MKKSILPFLALLVLAVFLNGCNSRGTSSLSVMAVAGGHNYDTAEFNDMLASLAGMEVELIMQPEANKKIAEGSVGGYDAIVFYDMWPEADEKTKAGYDHLIESGMGMVFLHHSLADYQQWEEFTEIIGGKYHTPSSPVDSTRFSGYRHDIVIPVKIVNPEHPVTRDMVDFEILDEGYSNIEVNDDVEILLTADHIDCHPVVGWTHEVGNAKIVYLMQGHDRHAYENPNFKRLLENAIRYVAE